MNNLIISKSIIYKYASWRIFGRSWIKFKREHNLSITEEQIENIFKQESLIRQKIKSKRLGITYDKLLNNKNHIIERVNNKKILIARFNAKAIRLSHALDMTFEASYRFNDYYIKFDNKYKFIRITWDTDTDWNYYSKSYHRPKTTYSNRRVELVNIAHGVVKIEKVYCVDSFRGKFLEKALKSFGIEKNNIIK